MIVTRSDLCDAFIICCWDQRGTGGSYWGVKDESLNLNQLISDGAELLEYLCKELGKEKIFIQGGSWGTELGTYLCIRHPKRIAAILLAIAVMVYSRYQDKEIVAYIDEWNAKQKAGK